MQPGEGRAGVVVGADTSATARDAVEWAADVAAVRRVPIEIVHVAAATGEPPSWLTALAEAAEARGARVGACRVLDGGIVDRLAERSATAGLVVVGSYGEGARSGMLAGSTALGLLDRAAGPVAVVRGSEPGVPAPRSGPIVVGVDDTVSGSVALVWGADLAADAGAALRVVHAWSEVERTPEGGERRREEPWDVLAAAADALLDRCVAEVAERYPELSVDRVAVPDAPLRALLGTAAEARAIVVGHRRPLTERARLGSTARGLVQFAPCPVVVVRPTAATTAADRAAARKGVAR